MKKIEIIYLLIIIIFCSGCQKNSYQRIYQLESAFSVTPVVYLNDFIKTIDQDQLVLEMSEIVRKLDLKYNPYNCESLLSLVNQEAGKRVVAVDYEFLSIVQKAIEVSALTKVQNQALFDITIFPLIELWDFRNKYYLVYGIQSIPSYQDIISLLPLVDYRKIILDFDNLTIFLQDEGMKIDLGSIIKGYAADQLKEYLLVLGFDNFIIDLGGNILVNGLNYQNNRPWIVGVMEPFNRNEVIGCIEANSYFQTFVTSGIYERYIMDVYSELYHHILSPNTGYPHNNDLQAVTIVAKESFLADAFSTAIFLMGLEKGLAFVEENPQLDALFITTSQEIIVSSGLVSFFEFNEDAKMRGYCYIS